MLSHGHQRHSRDNLGDYFLKISVHRLFPSVRLYRRNSGAGTNLKVGGCTRLSQRIVFWSCPFTFLALKVQLVVLVSAFVMVSTVWSVSCLLFFNSRCPRAQPFVKVGERAPVPYGVGATGSKELFSTIVDYSYCIVFNVLLLIVSALRRSQLMRCKFCCTVIGRKIVASM